LGHRRVLAANDRIVVIPDDMLRKPGLLGDLTLAGMGAHTMLVFTCAIELLEQFAYPMDDTGLNAVGVTPQTVIISHLRIDANASALFAHSLHSSTRSFFASL
jgi:hypothetical protein